MVLESCSSVLMSLNQATCSAGNAGTPLAKWQNGVAVTVAGAPFSFRQTVPLTSRMVLGVALPKEADRKG